MAKKYIQIKDQYLGEAYDRRSFLVSSENDAGFFIKKDSIFVAKEFALVVGEQRVVLDAGAYTVELVQNYKALAKERPDCAFPARVVDAAVIGGVLAFRLEGLEVDNDDEEIWWNANRFVLSFRPNVFDEQYYSARYDEYKKQVAGMLTQEFVEGITGQVFIVKGTWTAPNGNVTEGYHLYKGNTRMTPFAFFPSVEELRNHNIFKTTVGV